MDESTRNLKSPVEAAARLRRSAATLRNWRWRGEGPAFVKFGGRVHYTDEALDRFIREHEVNPAAGQGGVPAPVEP